MNLTGPTLFIAVATCFCCIQVQAQSDLVAGGADGTGSGGSVSFSVGQVAYTTNSDGGHSEAQGVQQPYEISVVTSTVETENIALEFITYPNPTSDVLTLKVGNRDNQELHYQLFELSGKLLREQRIISDRTSIEMSGLSSAAYVLNVSADGKNIKSFNIIKNQ